MTDARDRHRCNLGILLLTLAAGCSAESARATVAAALAGGAMISPELTSGQPIVTVTDYPNEDDVNPSVASDGQSFFVTWHTETGTYAFGTRVSPDGLVLDPPGNVFPSGVSNGSVLAYGGGGYVSVSAPYLDNATAITQLSPQGLPVSTRTLGTQAGGATAVAFDGASFLAVRRSPPSGGAGLAVVRVGTDGALLPGGSTSGITGVASDPRVAAGGGVWLAVWSNAAGDIAAARLDPGGNLLDTTALVIGRTTQASADVPDVEPSVAWDGAHFLVVWQTQDAAGAATLRAGRVGADGALLDGAVGFAVTSEAAGKPAVASDGDVALVAYCLPSARSTVNGCDAECTAIHAKRIAPDGTVEDGAGAAGFDVAGAGPTLRPFVAASADRFLVVWDARCADGDVFGTVVPEAGPPARPLAALLTGRLSNETLPAVGSDGTNYLAAWCDARAGFQIVAARMTADGNVLDPTGIALGELDTDMRPAIAFGGSTYVVAWARFQYDSTISNVYNGIEVVRISRDGQVLDNPPIEIHGAIVSTSADSNSPAEEPSVAWDGTSFVVAYGFYGGTRAGWNVLVNRVSPSGVVMDGYDGIAVSTPLRNQRHPSVASNGAGLSFIAWDDERNTTDGTREIYGARLTAAGVVSDPNGIAIATRAEDQMHPSVAFGAGGFLVAWEHLKSLTPWDVRATAIGTNGVVTTPGGAVISTPAQGVEPMPATAGFPDRVLVAWGSRTHLHGMRLGAGGRLIDASDLVLSALVAPDGERIEQNPALVVGAGSVALTAYESARGGGQHGIRLGLRFIDVAVDPAPVDAGADASDAGARGDAAAGGSDGGVGGGSGGRGGTGGGTGGRAGTGGAGGRAGGTGGARGGSGGAGTTGGTGGDGDLGSGGRATGAGGAGGFISEDDAGAGGAGGPDAAASLDSGGAHPSKSGCSCSIPSDSGSGGLGWAIVAALIALRRRRAISA